MRVAASRVEDVVTHIAVARHQALEVGPKKFEGDVVAASAHLKDDDVVDAKHMQISGVATEPPTRFVHVHHFTTRQLQLENVEQAVAAFHERRVVIGVVRRY